MSYPRPLSAGPSAARWSACTTRPGCRSWPPGCTRPASRSSPPARPRSVIADAGVPVTAVEELTGFPECLDGRVKTLHPRVHAGLLADTRRPEHLAQLAALDIAPFDLLVINLYPFTATVAVRGRPDECVEQIDIGGPAMVRAAAKNHASVAVVVDPAATTGCWTSVKEGGFTLADRRALAVTAFRHTAAYDVAVASWLGSVVAPDGDPFPGWVGATWDGAPMLRYGENPHQAAALYASGAPGPRRARSSCTARRCPTTTTSTPTPPGAPRTTTATCRASRSSSTPTRAASRSAQGRRRGPPQGARLRPGERVRRGDRGEPRGERRAGRAGRGDLHRGARGARLRRRRGGRARRKKNLRVLRLPVAPPRGGAELRAISGGLLLQQRDAIDAPGDDPGDLDAGHRRRRSPTTTLADLAFAWRACRAVKSNAILLAADGAAVGVGMGQVNRVDAARLAVAGPASGRAARWPPPTPTSRSPTGWRCCSTPGCARWCSPADRCATRSRSRPRGGRRAAVPHRNPPFRALTRRGRGTGRAGASREPGAAVDAIVFERWFDSASPRGARRGGVCRG